MVHVSQARDGATQTSSIEDNAESDTSSVMIEFYDSPHPHYINQHIEKPEYADLMSETDHHRRSSQVKFICKVAGCDNWVLTGLKAVTIKALLGVSHFF